MEKSLKKKRIKPTPVSSLVVTPAATKNKDKALHDIIGMWADRKETEDTKVFRNELWRRKDS